MISNKELLLRAYKRYNGTLDPNLPATESFNPFKIKKLKSHSPRKITKRTRYGLIQEENRND
jgi:hypothetical protein